MNAANSALAASAFFAGTPPPTTEPDVPPEPKGNVLCQCQMHPHPNIKLCDPPAPLPHLHPPGKNDRRACDARGVYPPPYITRKPLLFHRGVEVWGGEG